MKKNIQIILSTVILSVALWGGVSYAHSEHFEKPTRSAELSYDFRSATMSIYKWYLSPMGAMVKGKMKFDAKTFTGYAQALQGASMLHLMEGFPKESGEDYVDDSNAKEEIWSNLADFETKFKAFQNEAKKLAITANGGNEAAIKAQFKVTAGTCSSCHKKYKVK
jgi:cytochrome c556